MRKTENSSLLLWGGIGLVTILAIVLLWATGTFQFSNPRQVLASTRLPSPTESPAPVPLWPTVSGTAAHSATPTPPPPRTLDLPQLPQVTPPPGGQTYTIVPTAAAVGWMRDGDHKPNHLGDYNIYAGVYDGQAHLGALQFDLSPIPPGSPIVHADLTLVGLAEEWLGDQAAWAVQLLEPWLDGDWPRRTYADLAMPGGAVAQLQPALTTADLAAGRANIFAFGPQALEALALRTLTGQASFRVMGPTSGADNLFSWDSGSGTGSRGWVPVLRIVAGPPPATPPTMPTPYYVIITSTPTPENVVTEAAIAATATAQATTTGTPTPLPPNWMTPVVVAPTATPAGAATARWHAQVATAYAALSGTPTPLPLNVWTATPERTGWLVVVTNTFTPRTWSAAVAQAEAEATRRATAGPPTPFPPGVVTATPNRILVTATPRPQNGATAAAAHARATIDALTTGTATPTPRSWVTPTSLPLLVPLRQLSPTPAPTGTPNTIPRSLRGKIAFVSNRLGEPQIFVMDPDGRNVAWLTQRYPYDAALAREPVAPTGLRRAIVQPDGRGSPQIYLYDHGRGTTTAITHLDGMAYDPAWSPRGEPVAFVSTHQGNDEIYTANSDGSDLQRLTSNTWEWDKHPSWSPDGAQIAFYSNRYTGRRQIWIMDAGGSNPRNISDNEYEDWDPVWIK